MSAADVKLPEGDLGEKIQAAFDDGAEVHFHPDAICLRPKSWFAAHRLLHFCHGRGACSQLQGVGLWHPRTLMLLTLFHPGPLEKTKKAHSPCSRWKCNPRRRLSPPARTLTSCYPSYSSVQL